MIGSEKACNSANNTSVIRSYNSSSTNHNIYTTDSQRLAFTVLSWLADAISASFGEIASWFKSLSWAATAACVFSFTMLAEPLAEARNFLETLDASNKHATFQICGRNKHDTCKSNIFHHARRCEFERHALQPHLRKAATVVVT